MERFSLSFNAETLRRLGASALRISDQRFYLLKSEIGTRLIGTSPLANESV